MSKPRFVALCGAPGSGKTSVAEFLALRYDAKIVDDGMVLRRACSVLYQTPLSDFVTQEGKTTLREVCKGVWKSNRQLLGDLGNMLESEHSEQFMPEAAVRSCDLTSSTPFFLFPSCRKTQGITYRTLGGIVIEVARPGYTITHDFDRWDRDLVTHRIDNCGDLEYLQRATAMLFDQIMGGE